MENNNEFTTPIAEENNNGLDTSQDYIATIMAMKANSVSKDDYEKLKAENRQLLTTLVEGGQIENPEVKEVVDIAALRKELFNEDCSLTNLEYIKKTLKLRDALIENGEPDPFLPVNSKNSPTIDEINTAEKCAEIFKECIEYADGNSEIFTQELMRRTSDSMPMSARTRR